MLFPAIVEQILMVEQITRWIQALIPKATSPCPLTISDIYMTVIVIMIEPWP